MILSIRKYVEARRRNSARSCNCGGNCTGSGAGAAGKLRQVLGADLEGR